jgi:hypothetical protein
MQIAMSIVLSDIAQFHTVLSQEVDGAVNRKFSILMCDIVSYLPRMP